MDDQGGQSTKSKTNTKNKTSDAQIEMLEKQLKRALGTRVKIVEREKCTGKIVVDFSSSNEFSRLLSLLTGSSAQKDRAA